MSVRNERENSVSWPFIEKEQATMQNDQMLFSRLYSNGSASKRKSMKLSHKSTIPQCRYATIKKGH